MFSVVMAVCSRDIPCELEDALRSIIEQDMLPGEIVIVEDGVIGRDLAETINKFASTGPVPFVRVSYEKNMGPAHAWNMGLLRAKYELIARMDSDDLSRSNRFKLQYEYMISHPEVDVLGGYILEFDSRPGDGGEERTRAVPNSPPDISSRMKKRNAMNHVSVMFRKSAVLAVGGYYQVNNHVDYYLWIRMISNGSVFSNLDMVLVDVRSSVSQIGRRGGFSYIMSEIHFYYLAVVSGFISPARGVLNFLLRAPVRLLPLSLRKIVYSKTRA